MKSWIRIIVVVFVLIGGVSSFGYWSINEFNKAFDNLSATYLRDTPVFSAFKESRELASTSPEISGILATSTDSVLAFTFPQKDDEVYIGCTYSISWQSSTTTIDSLEAALIDAGTREAVGQKTGGLSKENIIEEDSPNLNWKVGFVWPGEYYIKISKINDFDTEIRSDVFLINKMPEGISADEQENICKESNDLS